MNRTTGDEDFSEEDSFCPPSKSKAWQRAIIDSDSDSDESDIREAICTDSSEETEVENATFENLEDIVETTDDEGEINQSKDDIIDSSDNEDTLPGEGKTDIVNSSDDDEEATDVSRNLQGNLEQGKFVKRKSSKVNDNQDSVETTNDKLLISNSSFYRDALASADYETSDEIDDESDGEYNQKHGKEDVDVVINSHQKNKKNSEDLDLLSNKSFTVEEANTDDDIVDESDGEDNHKHSKEDDDLVIRPQQKISENSDDLEEIITKSLSVVELSSEDESAGPVVLKQANIKSFLTSSQTVKPESEATNLRKVGEAEYQHQVGLVKQVEADLQLAKRTMGMIKLENLPDKGRSLLEKERSLQGKLQKEKRILDSMVIDTSKPALNAATKVEIAWEDIEAGVNAVGPRTHGTKGVARFNVEKQLAVETLDSLHKSLETCPAENDIVDDPKGLKVPLMPHQKRALAWLLWREKQKPSGGLLADDMGLGKTLTMISLIMKSQEMDPDDFRDKENHRSKYPGGTLVVCPASLINQWSGEIERRTKRGMLGVEVYHGTKRETKSKKLAKHDVVVTTYALVLSEHNKDGPLFGVRWRRIILDEAHQIRNHKSRTSEAVFRISGKSRWALTGTPIHNKELDMYAILKFLRCAPFDDLQVWKHWVGDKSTGGDKRLHAVISSLMLRRTKAELMGKGSLQSLPERTWELISVKLQADEMDVYQKVLIFSRTLFAQFLHQRAEKNQDAYDLKFNGAPPDPNGEYFKMRNKLLKLNRVKEVSQHEILVLLLRLRQICCHPSLIRQMLQGDEDLGDADDEEEAAELNLLEQLNKLNIDDAEEQPINGLSEESVGLKEASRGYLNAANPVFKEDRRSSKIHALIKILKEKVAEDDKAIVVSQWTNLLELVAIHFQAEGIPFDRLNGKIPVPKRMAIVDNFNDPNSETKVLLLSLTAGGVGLNLVGANHLFLLDLHWNPQLESQAQDRIYRMGQNKPINVYKFMAVDTIEERIKCLQDKKLEIADSMLTGSKRVGSSKLTLQDLKMLFDFK